MPSSRVFEFNGVVGDKRFWANRLGMTSWQSFYARIRRWESNPDQYPLDKVFSPLARKFYRDVEGKLSNFDISTGGCWVWKGNKTHDGYGRVRFEGKKRRAHMVSYEHFFGKIPEGKMICHKCGNPLCINPEHLYAGTASDNYADMVRHGRANRPKGRQIHTARLTELQVIEIRADHRTTRALAAVYGVGKSTIQQVKSGASWRHIPRP